ncbi:hypothetical protein [Aminipila luticellarii]|uniref:Uncharacterized protein n=1 Tax=Aminipila luticellarii TaxID=2507160 RepID=A0A410PVG9_9FIRM|nr:hypothetical protein [Aminipila luticellarii]QAT42941.1 hypothetical protein EQM06_06660 [Aminipila luticellarii]
MNTFKIEFFRLYDRKIASGELKFSDLGISKEEFTRLCTEQQFLFTEEKVMDLCKKMNLTKEETKKLTEACKK